MGVADEVGRAAGRVAAHGQADVTGDGDLDAAQVERGGHLFEDGVGDARRAVGPVDLAQHHGELGAAVAQRERTEQLDARQPARHLAQHLVAGIGPEPVVDVAQRVEVDEGQHHLRAGGASCPFGPLQPVVEHGRGRAGR